jgi:hypothetical protein
MVECEVGVRRGTDPDPHSLIFYLGTDSPPWLAQVDVPLFLSNRVLAKRRSFPVAVTRWALDSGGYTELSLYGEWQTTAAEYATLVARYRDEVGCLDWYAPQDWMCDPGMLTRTGLTVEEHQRRTVESVLDLSDRLPEFPPAPVLQGWSVDDYMRHAEMYDAAGVDLATAPRVGLGSVVRRQVDPVTVEVVHRLRHLRLHAFGVKARAVAAYGSLLASADSMAWSFAGRMNPDPDCPKRSCNHCQHYALAWRRRVLDPPTPSLWGYAGQ